MFIKIIKIAATSNTRVNIFILNKILQVRQSIKISWHRHYHNGTYKFHLNFVCLGEELSLCSMFNIMKFDVYNVFFKRR